MKNLLFGITPETTTPHELSLTFLRVFAGLSMAIAHGLGKVPPPEQLVQGVSAVGFPLPELFAWAAGLSELVGGILLAVGLFTRPAALFLSFTMLVAGVMVHGADPFNRKELAFIYLAIYLVFLMRGAGAWSIDRFISKVR